MTNRSSLRWRVRPRPRMPGGIPPAIAPYPPPCPFIPPHPGLFKRPSSAARSVQLLLLLALFWSFRAHRPPYYAASGAATSPVESTNATWQDGQFRASAASTARSAPPCEAQQNEYRPALLPSYVIFTRRAVEAHARSHAKEAAARGVGDAR